MAFRKPTVKVTQQTLDLEPYELQVKCGKDSITGMFHSAYGVQESKKGGKHYVRFKSGHEMTRVLNGLMVKAVANVTRFSRKILMDAGLKVKPSMKITVDAVTFGDEEEISFFPSQYTTAHAFNITTGKGKKVTIPKITHYKNMAYHVTVSISTYVVSIVKEEKSIALHVSPYWNLADVTMCWTGKEKRYNPEDMESSFADSKMKGKAADIMDYFKTGASKDVLKGAKVLSIIASRSKATKADTKEEDGELSADDDDDDADEDAKTPDIENGVEVLKVDVPTHPGKPLSHYRRIPKKKPTVNAGGDVEPLLGNKKRKSHPEEVSFAGAGGAVEPQGTVDQDLAA